MKNRDSAGALATFYHLRAAGMSAAEAHRCVRRWATTPRGRYEPNPLCMATRRELVAHYAKPGPQGD